jgi:hypothetical protein
MDPRLYDATAIASGFVPGSGLMDFIGQAPAIGGGMGPSFMQNIRNKQYIDAMLQMAGAAGDALMVVPPVGMTVKAATTAGKTARAGTRTADALAATKKAATAAPKAPQMSAAEARDAGYWHPIGNKIKLPIPISQMTAEREPVKGLIDRITINPESMQGGSIIPLTGDRSIAGQNLLGIGGTRFETPVYLEGGYDFMRTHSPEGTVWASEAGRLQGIQNRINQAGQNFGDDVFGVYSAMGPASMNFNVMMADSLLEQMKVGNLTKKSINAFDKEVKKIRPEWKGVMSPEARQQLEANGALRQAFVDRMQLKDFQEAGFPNIAYTRFAITDPRLLDEPMYASGLAVGRVQPGADLVTNPKTPHKTYNAQLRGEYMGGLDQSVPMSVMFPDWYKERRAQGFPLQGDVRSFDLAKPIQPTNQEWLDGLMNYLMRQQQTP